MAVKGYVKNVIFKGCFVMLFRNIDVKILFGNLFDGYVEDFIKEFFVGKFVSGKILFVEFLLKRVEVIFKVGNNKNIILKFELSDLSSLNVGDVVKGRIKRVELFGFFIVIDNTNLIGLCYVLEILDDRIDSIDEKFRVGERVKVKILKVDVDRYRILFGMKVFYFRDEDYDVSILL